MMHGFKGTGDKLKEETKNQNKIINQCLPSDCLRIS